jgi:DNA-binding PadR family transcriptional regulator
MTSGAASWKATRKPAMHRSHPQTVPRGFLRIYLLSLASKSPQTGYSIMQAIDDRTEGAWRPGPGTIYPLLEGLTADGFLKEVPSREREGSIAYEATAAGRKELEELGHGMGAAGRKDRAMMRLFLDLMPPEAFSKMVVSRGRDMVELFKEKILQVPQPERDSILKEFHAVLEGELAWVDSAISRRRR